METNVENLRKRILPILLFCQANKGDLRMYELWKNQEDAKKKLFYAYYSGLFCRILCMLEDPSKIFRSFVRDCNTLLDKYNWYDLQEEDFKHFKQPNTGNINGCEVPDALAFIDGVDNVAWKDSRFGNGSDAVCLKMEHGSWTFADVRGSTYRLS